MSDLTALLESRHQDLAPNFRPDVLQRDHTIFQFRFDNDEPFYLEVSQSEFSFAAGLHEAATLTLYFRDMATCWGLLEGKIDGMSAFMDGAYRADGNIVLSQLILYVFKPHEPTLAYEVMD